MAYVHEYLHLLPLLLLSFTACFLSAISTTDKTITFSDNSLAPSTSKPHRFVSKLIHHHSIHHPHYNPNETVEDRIKLDIEHSHTRLSFFKARIEGSLDSNNDYRTHLSPSPKAATILANLSIGQPPIPQLLIMDTASNIFWTMCTPCPNCIQHQGQIFDPSKSSTYVPTCKEPCHSKDCECDRVTYTITYADKSSSSGTVGKDMLVVETGDEGIASIPNIKFGCANSIIYGPDPGYNGIIGLGLDDGNLSLATQIGQKFSYCIGSLTDKDYDYNQLIIGEEAYLAGNTTPFQVYNGLNYVTLEGISVGEKSLDIAPGTFELKYSGIGGVIIDTGSTLTYLVDNVYELLCKEVRNLFQRLSFREVRIQTDPWALCYSGSVSRDLKWFPGVSFYFARGGAIVLDTQSFFLQVKDDVFCMSIHPVGNLEVSVIGLLAQQGYNVGYNKVMGLIYIERIDCQLLSS